MHIIHIELADFHIQVSSHDCLVESFPLDPSGAVGPQFVECLGIQLHNPTDVMANRLFFFVKLYRKISQVVSQHADQTVGFTDGILSYMLS